MSVIVQYIVKVPDVDRFVATSDKYAPMMEEMGSRNGSVYEDEHEPGLVSTISDWDSHVRCTQHPRRSPMTSIGKPGRRA